MEPRDCGHIWDYIGLLRLPADGFSTVRNSLENSHLILKAEEPIHIPNP